MFLSMISYNTPRSMDKVEQVKRLASLARLRSCVPHFISCQYLSTCNFLFILNFVALISSQRRFEISIKINFHNLRSYEVR